MTLSATSDQTAAIPVGVETTTVQSVSIVMPCLNEEETVGSCVAAAVAWLHASGMSGEVIVVDNGSTDRSVEVAEAAGARIVHERRRGYGQAYLRGFAEAKGEFIVMGDSDGTYDFTDIGRLIEPLQGGADMVLGNRFAGGIQPGAMPWAHRYIGSPIINFLIRLFFGTRVGDSQSGLRAFTRSAATRLGLRSSGMELASEMIVSAARVGLTIAEVPAPYGTRRGISKLSTVRDGWRHLRYLLLAAPDFLFTLPGVVLLAAGVAVTLLTMLAPGGLHIGPLTWAPVFAGTILLAIGANCLMFGVIAKLYGWSRGLLKEDRWVRLYRRYLRLEWILAVAASLFGTGLLLDLGLLIAWAGGRTGLGLQLAALAQSLLIVGGQLGMAAFLAVTVHADAPRAED